MTTLGAEWLKLRSTRTLPILAGSAAAVVTLAAALHFGTFEPSFLDGAEKQRDILVAVGVNLGLLFAAISGSLGITAEHRHGTIRPTLLKRPDRLAVLAAKALVQLLTGAALAALTTGYAVALAATLLRVRDLDLLLDGGSLARLVVGAGVGGAAFALLGLALGTLLRSQVPVVVGLLIWVLLLEQLLRGGLPDLARFAPASLGQAIATDGAGLLSSPVAAAAALTGSALVTLAAAAAVFAHRDLG